MHASSTRSRKREAITTSTTVACRHCIYVEEGGRGRPCNLTIGKGCSQGLEADALHGWLTSAGLQNVEAATASCCTLTCLDIFGRLIVSDHSMH